MNQGQYSGLFRIGEFIGRTSCRHTTPAGKVSALGMASRYGRLHADVTPGGDRQSEAHVFFPASGNYNGTSLNNRGTNGNYWSASFNNSSNAYNLNFNSSNVNPQNNNNRNRGRSVRAVQHSLIFR